MTVKQSAAIEQRNVSENSKEVLLLPLSKIQNPNPRSYYSDLQSMTESIAELGVLEPILVRKTAAAEYELIAGRQRLAACIAGVASGKLPSDFRIPSLVSDDGRDDEIILVENILRNELDIFDEAERLSALMTRHNFQYAAQLARKLPYLGERYLQKMLKVLRLPASIKNEYLELTAGWVKRFSGPVPIRRTQIYDLAHKTQAEQIEAWKVLKQKLVREIEKKSSDEVKLEHTIISDLDKALTPSDTAPQQQNAITFKPKLKPIPLANSVPALPVSNPDDNSAYIELEADVDNTTVADHVAASAIKGSEPTNSEIQSILNLEQDLPDFEYALSCMKHDLSRFNPAAYEPINKEALIEALEIFTSTALSVAEIARDIKHKYVKGQNQVAAELESLKKEVLGDVLPVDQIKKIAVRDISRNSFDEIFEVLVEKMPQEKLKEYEKFFLREGKLNATTRKRNPDLFLQLRNSLIIEELKRERERGI